jgi:hypothetical protein
MDAAACAARITNAMRDVSPRLRIEARATPKGTIEIILTSLDERGRVEDIREQEQSELFATAAAAGDARFDAFLAATASWLRAQASPSELFGHDMFLVGVLADRRLVTEGDFGAILMNAAARELYEAHAELQGFFERHGIAPPDEHAVRALFVLTPEGRARKGITESVRATHWLAASDWGRKALVAMMGEWANEEYDPFDLAWSNGPTTTNLLIGGVWRLLDAQLSDGELRGRAIAAVNRLERPVDAATLARAGF